MPIYEYLVVYHDNTTGTKVYELWRPNVTDAEKRQGDLPLATLFNELGQDGWKLTDSTVLDLSIITRSQGWPEYGLPVRQRWTFARVPRS